MLTACPLFWSLTISSLVLVMDNFRPWPGVGTEHWSCLVGPGGGSGDYILVDFPVYQEVDCPEPILPG